MEVVPHIIQICNQEPNIAQTRYDCVILEAILSLKPFKQCGFGVYHKV